MFEVEDEESRLLGQSQSSYHDENEITRSDKSSATPSNKTVISALVIICVSCLVFLLIALKKNSSQWEGSGITSLESVRISGNYKSCSGIFKKGVSIDKKPGCVYLFAHTFKGKDVGSPMTVVCSCDVEKALYLDQDALASIGMTGMKNIDAQVAVVATGPATEAIVHHGKRFDKTSTRVKPGSLVKLDKLVDDQGFPVDNRARSVTIVSRESSCKKIKLCMDMGLQLAHLKPGQDTPKSSLEMKIDIDKLSLDYDSMIETGTPGFTVCKSTYTLDVSMSIPAEVTSSTSL